MHDREIVSRPASAQLGRSRSLVLIGLALVAAAGLYLWVQPPGNLEQTLPSLTGKLPEVREKALDLTETARDRLRSLTRGDDGGGVADGVDADGEEGLSASADRVDPEALMNLYDPEQVADGPLPEALPDLNDSDPRVRDRIRSLDTQDLLAGWLIDEELVRRFVVMVDNIADGRLPRKHSLLAPPKGPFQATEEGERYWLNPASYRRYDPYTQVFLAIDRERAVQAYRQFYPLMQQAYGELGFPRRSFHARLIEALDTLLAAPVVEGPIELVRPTVMYKYADPRRERLPAAQKQLIRMGPDNSRQLQERLADYREVLSRLTHQRS